jgi:hypothetical protein
MTSSYSHTQRAPLCWLLYGSALLCFLIGLTGDSVMAWSVAGGTGLMMSLLASSMHWLTVCDQGDRLSIQFGPLPVFGRYVKYADIKDVETTRSSLLDGWGIHYRLGRGWIWNLWGWDCVAVRFHDGTQLRIGTDDAPQLAAFLTQQARGK